MGGKKHFWSVQKQIGLGFILLGILVVVSVFIFLSYSVVILKGIPELLPEKETASFVQFDLRNPSLKKRKKLLVENYLVPWLNDIFKINYEKEILPHVTGLLAMAWLTPVVENDPLIPVFIAETDQKSPLPRDFFEKHGKNLDIGISGSFITLSPSPKLSLRLFDAGNDTLAGSFVFLKTLEGIPGNAFSYFYVRPEYFKKFFSKYSLPHDAGQTLGGYMIGAENGVFLTFRATGNKIFPQANRYSGRLLSLFPENPKFLLGGAARQEGFSSETQKAAKSALNAYNLINIPTEKLTEELIQNEYGVGLYENDNFLFISEIKDKEKMNEGLKDLEKLMPSIVSILKPEIQEVTLPDGTKGKELVARPINVSKIEEELSGKKIIVFQSKKQDFELALYTDDKRVFFSSDRNLIKRAAGGALNFKQSDSYNGVISEVLRGVHEIMYLKPEILKKTLPPLPENLLETGLGIRYEDDFASVFSFLRLE